MIGVNWPNQNKRDSTVDIREEGKRKVTVTTPDMSKATTIAGIVLCSRCKCECELEIPAGEKKIDEQLIQQEINMITASSERYGSFSPKGRHDG